MPVIGMIPMTIPTLTTSWKSSIDATPLANDEPERVARPPGAGQHPPEQRDEQHEQDERAR